MTQEPVLTLQHLSLSLSGQGGQVNILHDIDLQIHKKETLAITGPSGSGKTSLLMLMAGLERPSAGEIRLGQHDISNASEDELAVIRGQHIGIVFQAFHLIPTMTALENVMIPLSFLRDGQAQEKAEQALVRLGLSHRLTHYPSQLSGGEQQRVAIARAFVTSPTLILADEPTGNLDHATGEKVIDVLFEQCEQHDTTLVLVTHDPALAERCSRIIHLSDGRIVHG